MDTISHPLFVWRAFIYVLSSLSFLSVAQAANIYPWPEGSDTVIGDNQLTQVAEGETLLDIAERFGLGYADIRDANPDLDPWIPAVGAEVRLPTRYILPATPWQGIVINLAEFRLYYFLPEQDEIHTYPIGIGRSNTPTPQGEMQISARIPNPTWYPPASIRQRWQESGEEVRWQIPAGPDNPLGPFAINLSAKGYLIHGTNQRFGIGAQTSAGCIRMNNRDIEALVSSTKIGVPVRIINEPTKVGILANQLVLKSHRPLSPSDSTKSHTDLVYALSQLRQQESIENTEINWHKVEQVFNHHQGIAEVISH